MKFFKLTYNFLLVGAIFFVTSCNDYLDINVSPNAVSDAPIEQLLTGITTNVGFTGGSDLNRFASLLVQQYSGQGAGATTQPQEYERYNIQGSDLNNLWNSLYSTTLSDIEIMIKKANESNSPHYAGVGKILKAYTYHLIADTWGKAPYFEALKFTDNLSPKFDDASVIYDEIFKLLDEGIADVSATTSVKSPGTNSTIYPGTFTNTKINWIKLANTLKMRLYLHYSKVDKNKMIAGINATANNPVFAGISDNFQMSFINSSRAQNPIHQFQLDRVNQLFPNNTIVSMMNGKSDPRRPRYFTPFPFTYNQSTATYLGAMGGDAPSEKYSRIHIFLRGDTTKTAFPIPPDGSLFSSSYDYTGAAPIRMLTYAEYCFIRAEAAVYGAEGNAEQFFQQGIRASMSDAGVSVDDVNAYVAANGTLAGSDNDKIKKIIEEKFVANFGVALESWTDYRRTGFPVLTPPSNSIEPALPRSFFYPQSEMDLNPNAPAQKANLAERIFWDN